MGPAEMGHHICMAGAVRVEEMEQRAILGHWANPAGYMAEEVEAQVLGMPRLIPRLVAMVKMGPFALYGPVKHVHSHLLMQGVRNGTLH